MFLVVIPLLFQHCTFGHEVGIPLLCLVHLSHERHVPPAAGLCWRWLVRGGGRWYGWCPCLRATATTSRSWPQTTAAPLALGLMGQEADLLGATPLLDGPTSTAQRGDLGVVGYGGGGRGSPPRGARAGVTVVPGPGSGQVGRLALAAIGCGRCSSSLVVESGCPATFSASLRAS